MPKRLKGEIGTSLTPRQREITELVIDGLLNKEIGFELGITQATVKNMMTDIMARMHVTNRTELAVLAVLHPEALDGERNLS